MILENKETPQAKRRVAASAWKGEKGKDNCQKILKSGGSVWRVIGEKRSIPCRHRKGESPPFLGVDGKEKDDVA